MKELLEIPDEVAKEAQEIVDEDIEKVQEEAGEIEKESPKLFGLDLGPIVGLQRFWKPKGK